ncbi:hypothetical protein BDV39DRAFT_197713 [Aspergillus sergii]|uniref:Uncharacterized protein n=1 Tax=Aspergillus sergii TaxID=1034303 RepID=A0A5N6WP69_9EURO|nr:hypothetical protein BDV39DRAFT_197713 [Aspergillus sergii]
MSGESLQFLILEATAMSGEPAATGLPPPSPATTATASFVDQNEAFSEGQIYNAHASFKVVVYVPTTGGGYSLEPRREALRQTCQSLFRKSEGFTFAEMYTVMMHSSPVQTLTGQSGKFFLKYIRDQLQDPEFCNTEDGKLATLAVQLQAQVCVRLNNSGPARPATLEYLWPEMKEDNTAPVTWMMSGVFDSYSGLFRLYGTLDELIDSLEHGK